MEEQDFTFNRDVMIAVDESENSFRAVSYVGRLLGGLDGCNAIIMHVINEPGEDYFSTPEEHEKWICHYKKKFKKILEKYHKELVIRGFHPDSVSTVFITRKYPSIVECILSERDKNNFGTVVVGRHGIPRNEEFMFGSISNIMVHHARNCAVWVIE